MKTKRTETPRKQRVSRNRDKKGPKTLHETQLLCCTCRARARATLVIMPSATSASVEWPLNQMAAWPPPPEATATRSTKLCNCMWPLWPLWGGVRRDSMGQNLKAVKCEECFLDGKRKRAEQGGIRRRRRSLLRTLFKVCVNIFLKAH